MMELRVQVWGETITITVHQRSKSVWVASGEHLGETITVQNRSWSSAAALWASTAKYRGN
jgi:hypothetical protein